MNKEQIDEIAMAVWNETESECDSRTGRQIITDFANALLAELAKVSEPVMADGKTRLSDYLASAVSESVIMDDWTKGYEECKRRLYKIVGHQLRQLTPQPDLVAEIERLKVENSKLKTLPMKYRRMEFNAQLQKEADELRQQLATAQVDNEQLVKALESITNNMFTSYTARNGRSCSIEDGSGEMCYIVPHEPIIEAQEAIAAYKARKE